MITDYQDDPNAPCRWLFYRDRDVIPDIYFTRIGKMKPDIPSVREKLASATNDMEG